LNDNRESFDDIYLDLSKQSGKCRLAESGIGWKTSSATWTLDKTDIISAQWSRAAKGYEVKLIARTAGVVQLDGFRQEVCRLSIDRARVRRWLIVCRTSIRSRNASKCGTALKW